MKIPESDLKILRAEQDFAERNGYQSWWCPAKHAKGCKGPLCPRFSWAGQPEFKENWAECGYAAFAE